MKHMKHIYMILGALAVAAAGYMAYQRYNAQGNVKIQVYGGKCTPIMQQAGRC